MVTLLLLICAAIATAQPTITRIVPSESVELRQPEDLSVGGDGTLYITDTGHNRVLSVDENGKLLSEIGSSGSGQGEFQWPKRIAAENGLNIWVVDYGNRRIVKLSRLLEFQGAFEVRLGSDARPEQVSEIALSPQGDVYLYAEDSGQILRYDPLFVLQAQLGSLTGSEFIPRIRSLVYVKGFGVVWQSRGSKALSGSDAMLSAVTSFPVPWKATERTELCPLRKCLLAADSTGIYNLCEQTGSADQLFGKSVLDSAGVKHVDAMACLPGVALYLLESRTGSVFKVTATKL